MKICGEFKISKCHGAMCSLCAHAKRKHDGYTVVASKGKIIDIHSTSSISECLMHNKDHFNSKSKTCDVYCPLFV